MDKKDISHKWKEIHVSSIKGSSYNVSLENSNYITQMEVEQILNCLIPFGVEDEQFTW